jgi:hypothetical protein
VTLHCLIIVGVHSAFVGTGFVLTSNTLLTYSFAEERCWRSFHCQVILQRCNQVRDCSSPFIKLTDTGVQNRALEKTDARVQTVLESVFLCVSCEDHLITTFPAISVLRMVKYVPIPIDATRLFKLLFRMLGWEKQVHSRIAERRQEELTWVWWRKVLMTASFILKSVDSLLFFSLRCFSIVLSFRLPLCW